MPRLPRPAIALPGLLLALAACSDDAGGRAGADAGGTIVVASSSDADILFPPLAANATARAVVDNVFDHLADIGPELNVVGDAGFTPRLARSWSWGADSLSIAFALDPRARWHDGTPVTARDVAFTHALYRDAAVAAPAASLIANIDSVTVRDSLTAVFWFARRAPDQFYEATYQMVVLPEHLLGTVPRGELRSAEFARNPVGSGRFRFVRWEPGARIELAADTANYRGRALLDRVIFSVKPEYAASIASLLTGEADFVEIVRPAQHKEVAAKPDVRLVPYPSLQYGFLQFNLRRGGAPHPLLSEPGLRRAFVLALDREAMLRNVFDTLAVVPAGPVPTALGLVEERAAQAKTDTAAARALLDSLGWRDANGDGIRERNGRPLRFTLMTPASSGTRDRYAALIQERLRLLGVDVVHDRLDGAAFTERLRTGNFDAAVGALGADPGPSGLRQSWGTSGITAGLNFGGYASPVFDAYVDSASATSDPAKARAYVTRAAEVINADAPAIWLYDQRFTAGAHRRLEIPTPRADAWWAGMADWRVPRDRRIARDGATAGS